MRVPPPISAALNLKGMLHGEALVQPLAFFKRKEIVTLGALNVEEPRAESQYSVPQVAAEMTALPAALRVVASTVIAVEDWIRLLRVMYDETPSMAPTPRSTTE